MSTHIGIAGHRQAVVLCTALAAASAVWAKDCPESLQKESAVPPASASQASTPGGLSPAGLYALLHDVALNGKDGLGNYDDDYQARYGMVTSRP